MSIPEEKIKNLILIMLRSAPKLGLSYRTVFSQINGVLLKSTNDKTWEFAIHRNGTYSVARSMVTAGLLDKFSFNRSIRILRLTQKGRKLAEKI